ncbi:MAG: enoyl-CoA hydratase/isomerase family protein [Mycobacterium leprae]
MSDIHLDRVGGLATITLRRPRAMNAFTLEMWQEITAVLAALEADTGVRTLVLQGDGGQFTSGSDLRQFGAMNLEEAENAFTCMEEALARLERLPFPVVAALDGFALGAGLQLALACDLRVATERAQLGMPLGRFGILASVDFARRMVDLAGPACARDLLYTGRVITAEVARQYGLVDRLVPVDKLNEAVAELVSQMEEQSPSSLRAAKEAVAAALRHTPHPSHFVHAVDFPEGVSAFLERRRPHFSTR